MAFMALGKILDIAYARRANVATMALTPTRVALWGRSRSQVLESRSQHSFTAPDLPNPTAISTAYPLDDSVNSNSHLNFAHTAQPPTVRNA
jgi:hypothetical protein